MSARAQVNLTWRIRPGMPKPKIVHFWTKWNNNAHHAAKHSGYSPLWLHSLPRSTESLGSKASSGASAVIFWQNRTAPSKISPKPLIFAKTAPTLGCNLNFVRGHVQIFAPLEREARHHNFNCAADLGPGVCSKFSAS